LTRYNGAMSVLATTVLYLVVLLLTAAGAGIFPWTLFAATILLPAVALPALLQKHPLYTNRQLASPILLLLLYSLLMLAPVPDCIHALSRSRAIANETATNAIGACVQVMPDITNRTSWFALTRSQAGTIRFLLLCVAGFSAWSILRQTSDRIRQHWLMALLALGTLTAVAGVLGKWVFPQGDTLYWYLAVPHGRPGPMGGFINRNHFGGFLAILVPAALCMSYVALARRRWVLSSLSLGITGLLATGVLLSLSRGGTLALIAGLLATTITTIYHAPSKRKIAVFATSLLLIGVGILCVLHVPPLRTRFASWRDPATQAAARERWNAWEDTLAIAKAYPILGAGPNAFRTVYPQHRLTTDRAARDFSENEYVQWLAETGLAGLLIALGFGGIVIRRTWQFLRPREGDPPNHFAPAALGALAAAATHAFVDFPLRLPLYAITLASLAALLWPAPRLSYTRPAAVHVGVLATGLLLALLLLPVNLRLDAPGTIAAASPPTAIRALQAAPTYPIAWRRLSAICWETGNPEAQQLALDLLTQATYYDPNNYVLWRTLGQRRQAFGDNAGANEAYERVRELRDWVNVPHLPEDT
jgi:O-antigen ligase